MMQWRVVSLVVFASLGFADQISMKNGDRLTGSVIKSDGKDLVLKSDLAGQVTIPWDAVTAVNSTEQLHVGLKDGQVVVGTVTTLPDGAVQVATRDTGMVSTTRDKIDFLRSNAEQA